MDRPDGLARALEDKFWFAGEAVGMPYVALCNGAYKSGEDTAKKLIRSHLLK